MYSTTNDETRNTSALCTQGGAVDHTDASSTHMQVFLKTQFDVTENRTSGSKTVCSVDRKQVCVLLPALFSGGCANVANRTFYIIHQYSYSSSLMIAGVRMRLIDL